MLFTGEHYHNYTYLLNKFTNLTSLIIKHHDNYCSCCKNYSQIVSEIKIKEKLDSKINRISIEIQRNFEIYCSSYENLRDINIKIDNKTRMENSYNVLKDCLPIFSKNCRVIFSGRREPLPEKVLKAMDKIVEDTKNNTSLVLNICLNYGSHAEMVDTTKKICEMYKSGNISLDDIDEEFIQHNLYQDLPPLDFVIRTSGELRLSNFMMYQASYAEFYFPKVYFPDFTTEEFDKAIDVYNKRDRRFGGTK
jgi:undecaprenyl diphosphate synthase